MAKINWQWGQQNIEWDSGACASAVWVKRTPGNRVPVVCLKWVYIIRCKVIVNTYSFRNHVYEFNVALESPKPLTAIYWWKTEGSLFTCTQNLEMRPSWNLLIRQFIIRQDFAQDGGCWVIPLSLYISHILYIALDQYYSSLRFVGFNNTRSDLERLHIPKYQTHKIESYVLNFAKAKLKIIGLSEIKTLDL